MSERSFRCPQLEDLPIPHQDRTGWPWTEQTPQLPDRMPDGSPWPRISIVMPSYNQGQFIQETIRSVLLQGYPDIEFIIMDGGSSDDSVEIIKKYSQWLAHWVSEPDRGQSHAINKGIQRASGEILFWINSDDLCLPEAFHRAAFVFHANPSVRLVSGQARLIDAQGMAIGELRSYFTTWEDAVTNPANTIRQVSTFFLRSLFDELGLLDENPHLAMDIELLVRFTQFHTPLILSEYLAAFRTHANANTQRELLRWYEEADRTRGKYLSNKKLRTKYKERSSVNWINLSESEDRVIKQRIKCLLFSIKLKPLSLLTHEFWAAARKIALPHKVISSTYKKL
jgi:glycosyltransferase involved in cell wall biosynthesis